MAWTSLYCSRLPFSKSLLYKTIQSAYPSSLGLTSTPLKNCLSFSHFHRKSKSNVVGQSFILVQDGSDFQELPVIVRRLTSEDSINLLGPSKKQKDSTTNVSKDEFTDVPEESVEVSAIIDGFNKCYSPKGIFALLDIIPSDEVTPYVALKALQQIIKLENNKEFRNNIQCSQNIDLDEEDEMKNFTRIAVFTQLVNTLITSDNSSILLNGLKLVSRDIVGRKCDDYKNKLCEEVLCRVTDGKFSIEQTCEAVKVFAMLGDKEGLEKLWVGIVDKSKDIDETNILNVFRCLPNFGKSRKLIMSYLEKKMLTYWWKLSSRDVAEILYIFKENKISSNRILGVLSRWINTNIHAVNEEDLLNIVHGFRALDFNNQGIDKALERYVKAKSIKIQNPLLMKSIADYCLQFRMRSPSLLQGAAEFLALKGDTLSPSALKSVFTSIGCLDYRPTNGLQFWQAFESVFEQKFVQFRPDDALDVLMACIYLEKYPLNFVAKVFNPNFLDRIHYSQNENAIDIMRSKLKLLDAAMTLECSLYDGPLLPKDKLAKGIWHDNRIKRLLHFISDNINDVFGPMNKISLFNVLPQLPLNNIYLIDALVYPNNLSLAMNVFRDCRKLTAVLVMLPEYYCSDGSLIGPQVMRKRHFNKLGFKLVTLEYSMLARLRVHPKELNEYLNERLKVADDEAKNDSQKNQ